MDYRISTITCISQLSNTINLDKLYKNVDINDNIKYIEYGIDNYKGFAKKKKLVIAKGSDFQITFLMVTVGISQIIASFLHPPEAERPAFD